MPRWLLFTLLTVLLWGGWGFASRKLGDSLSAEQTFVISTLAMLPVIGVLALRKSSATEGARRGMAVALAGGLFGGVGNLAFYRLLNAGEKAATTVPLTALYPVITVALAILFLRERINLVQVGGIALSLGAIYFFNVGRDAAFWNRWLTFALLPLAFWGIAAFYQKVSTRDLSAERSCFWFLVGYLPVVLFVALTAPMKGDLPLSVWLWALALGLALGLGNLTVLAAYASDGKAAVITPLSGLYPVVTVPLAILWLGERVSPREWIGIGLSVAAVVALSRETPAAKNASTLQPSDASTRH
jgi:transporter family protein